MRSTWPILRRGRSRSWSTAARACPRPGCRWARSGPGGCPSSRAHPPRTRRCPTRTPGSTSPTSCSSTRSARATAVSCRPPVRTSRSGSGRSGATSMPCPRRSAAGSTGSAASPRPSICSARATAGSAPRCWRGAWPSMTVSACAASSWCRRSSTTATAAARSTCWGTRRCCRPWRRRSARRGARPSPGPTSPMWRPMPTAASSPTCCAASPIRPRWAASSTVSAR